MKWVGEILDSMKEQLPIINESLMDECSWGHEIGVLISGNEALELIRYIESLRRNLL